MKPVFLLSVAHFLILIWGSAFTLVGAAVRTLSPEWLVGYRMIIGAAFVLTYSRLIGHRLPPLKDCLLYTSPSPRDLSTSRMPSSA